MRIPEHRTPWLTPFAEERGIALVIALLAMVILSILGVTFLSMSATEIAIASNEVDASRAFFLTEAGTAVANGRYGVPPTGTRYYRTHPRPSPVRQSCRPASVSVATGL